MLLGRLQSVIFSWPSLSDMSEIKLDTLVLRVTTHQLAPTRCPLWVLEIQHPKLGIVNRDLGSGSPNTAKGPGKTELDTIAEMELLLIIIINQCLSFSPMIYK